ncbi:MAG: GDP-mannose 4,6-dehydratase [Candidatus Zipacnadales bacterium]
MKPITTWSHRRVLVTGGYGFVGSHLLARLLNAGANCFTIAIERPAQSYLSVEGLESGVSVTLGDVGDRLTLERILNEHEIEIVFHLAAQSIVGVASRSPLSTFEANVRGTYVLLEECRRLWREGAGHLRAVVVASSDKAYGEQPVLPYTEAHPLQGLNPYDASKVCADVLARSFAYSYGLPVAVTRCANIYGPGDLNFSRLIPSVMRDLTHGVRPIIRSDGSPVRDYLYITDAVEGYVRLAEALREGCYAGEAFNFGSGDPVSVLEITREMIAVSDKQHLEPDVRGQAVGELSRQFIDATKARECLGWVPQTPRLEGLRQSWKWYSTYLASDLVS